MFKVGFSYWNRQGNLKFGEVEAPTFEALKKKMKTKCDKLDFYRIEEVSNNIAHMENEDIHNPYE